MFAGKEAEVLGGLACRHTTGMNWESEEFTWCPPPPGRVLVGMAPDYPEENLYFGNSTRAWQLNFFLSPREFSQYVSGVLPCWNMEARLRAAPLRAGAHVPDCRGMAAASLQTDITGLSSLLSL